MRPWLVRYSTWSAPRNSRIGSALTLGSRLILNAPSPVTRVSATARLTRPGRSFSSASCAQRAAASWAVGPSKSSSFRSAFTMPARISTIMPGRPLWALRMLSSSGAAAQNRARLTSSSPSSLNSWSSSQASPRYQMRLRSTLVSKLTGSRITSPLPEAG